MAVGLVAELRAGVHAGLDTETAPLMDRLHRR